MSFRYDTTGPWFKGNTHIHSVASDGGKTFAELADLYASADYDFLFRTDHWVASDVREDAATYPLLWLDGIELDGKDHTGSPFHVVCLGRVEGMRREDGLEEGLRKAGEQGALRILAHPHWCGNTLDDSLRWSFDGVEIYNHVCHWLNGKSNGATHWDAMLDENVATLAFASDDVHLRAEHRGWNGGWVVVNAPECSAESILESIRRGNYYSSCGPEFKRIALQDGEIHAETSPVQLARLVGPRWSGQRLGSYDGEPLSTLRFTVPEGWAYAYLEIEDMAGRRAWTNALFV